MGAGEKPLRLMYQPLFRMPRFGSPEGKNCRKGVIGIARLNDIILPQFSVRPKPQI